MRAFFGQLVGVQSDLQIWWPPNLPVVYISNPKAGCSTIKHSLKTTQAAAYARSGTAFQLTNDPHVADDCLRKFQLRPEACRDRYLISCVRNPFSRALSGFLDKVTDADTPLLPDFGYRRLDDFDEFLRVLAASDPRQLNSHFRPQHINLDLPRIRYDAIFYLENIAVLPRYLSALCPDFELNTFAPHSRGAAGKLRRHYTDRSADLVRKIFAEDFELFGYSQDLDEADDAPGELIAAGEVIPPESDVARLTKPPQISDPGSAFAKTLRYRRLIDLHLI
jgi:sulfotransferase famil protein